MLFLIMNYLMVATVFIIMRITGTEHLMRVAPGIGILLFSYLCLCCMLLPSAFDGILTSNHNKAKKKLMILISNLWYVVKINQEKYPIKIINRKSGFFIFIPPFYL